MVAQHLPGFLLTCTSFQNRFFSDTEGLVGCVCVSLAGTESISSTCSATCSAFPLNSGDGAGALGGGPWAVTGCAMAALKGEE